MLCTTHRTRIKYELTYRKSTEGAQPKCVWNVLNYGLPSLYKYPNHVEAKVIPRTPVQVDPGARGSGQLVLLSPLHGFSRRSETR